MKTGNEAVLPEEKLDQEINDQLGDDIEEDGLSWMAEEPLEPGPELGRLRQ